MTTPAGTVNLRHWAVDFSIMVQATVTEMIIWEDKTSDAYWDITRGTWDGSRWVCNFNGDEYRIQIEAKDWATGYRPNRIRLTYTGNPAGFYLGVYTVFPSVGTVTCDNYLSLQELELAFTVNDIELIQLTSLVEVFMTKIEFGFEV